ncbi:MAG: DEAD/DEAH box helicase [bacterium]|nr:DEAD/DEAH box helicase [bacterium]
MTILHLCWNTDNIFHLWGEELPESGESENNLLLQIAPTNLERLRQIVESLEAEADGESILSLTLPAQKGIVSPSVMTTEHNFQEAFGLGFQQVETLKFDVLSALALLSSLPSPLPPQVQISDSFIFWIEATKFLLELLTKGRFLPLLEREDNQFVATWRPVFHGREAIDKLHILADCIPDSAYSLEPGEQQSHTEYRDRTLRRFLNVSANSLIRAFLSRRPAVDFQMPTVPSPALRTARNWLEKLTGSETTVSGITTSLLELEHKLLHWSSPVVEENQKPDFRLMFRLEPEPVAETEDSLLWRISLLLSGTSANSRIISLASLWENSPSLPLDVSRNQDNIEEHVLTELGHAIKVFSPLRRCLAKTRYPEHVDITTEECYEFMREISVKLEECGYVVDLPTWWLSGKTSLGLHLEISPPGNSFSPTSGMLGLAQLVNYNWQIAIGDIVLNKDEFEKLVMAKVPLVKLRDRWLQFDPEKLRSSIDYTTRNSHGQMSLIRALRLAAGNENERASSDETDPENPHLPVLSSAAGGWLGELFSTPGNNKLETISPPEHFCGTLRHYQTEGLSWLHFLSNCGLGACLADDMGLGKTIQLLALMSWEEHNLPAALKGPTLLFAPMSVIENWRMEARTFTPELRVYLHHGPERAIEDEFLKKATENDLVVTTYALAHRDFNFLSRVAWKRIVLDEAQNIKNTSSKQTQAIRNLGLTVGLGNHMPHKIALTGTPLENHLSELWSIFDFLNPDFLGSFADFKASFITPIEKYRDKSSEQSLASLVKPFILRRMKNDPEIISDLPEKIEMPVYTGLTPEQAALYESVVSSMIPEVEQAEGIHRKGLVLAMITRLKQICDHPALYLKDGNFAASRSAKLSLLHETLEVLLAEGDRALIFTQFAKMGEILRQNLSERFNREVLFLHGGVSRQMRDKIVETFRTSPDVHPIFVLSLKAGGFGLNLTQANQVIHFDQWWNPAVHEQATDRAFRIGQKRTVQVRRFICSGTLEERIAEILERKQLLADAIVGAPKTMLTEMSTDRLQELLRFDRTRIMTEQNNTDDGVTDE